MKRVVISLIALVLVAGAGGALLAHLYWKKTVTKTITKTIHAKAAPVTAIGPCTTGDLSAALNTDVGGGTAGSIYTELSLKNTSSGSCTLQGFPDVQMTTASNTTVGTPADHDAAGGAGTLLTLASGGSAKATLRFVSNNFPAGTCKENGTLLKVTPPSATTALTVTTSITTWCPGFSVTALTQ